MLRHIILKTLIICLSASIGTSFADEILDLNGPRVVRAPIPDDFTVIKKFLRQGEITEDGRCEFKTRLRLESGQKSIEQIEIAYDPDTCKSIVVQGYFGEDNFSSSTEDDGKRHWASFETWIRDPVFITLNEVQSKIWWTPAGGCAVSTSPSFEPSFDWFELTGWFVVESDSFHGQDCGSVELNSTATYRSESFPTCGDGASTIYKENYVLGYSDGSSEGYSLVSREGPEFLCTDLWTERTRLTAGIEETLVLDGELGCSGFEPALFFTIDIEDKRNPRFHTESSGQDYSGEPIYFDVDGTLEGGAINADVAMYADAAKTVHIRTDNCQGPFDGQSFYDASCDLILDTTAGCNPIWMSLEAIDTVSGEAFKAKALAPSAIGNESIDIGFSK